MHKVCYFMMHVRGEPKDLYSLQWLLQRAWRREHYLCQREWLEKATISLEGGDSLDFGLIFPGEDLNVDGNGLPVSESESSGSSISVFSGSGPILTQIKDGVLFLWGAYYEGWIPPVGFMARLSREYPMLEFQISSSSEDRDTFVDVVRTVWHAKAGRYWCRDDHEENTDTCGEGNAGGDGNDKVRWYVRDCVDMDTGEDKSPGLHWET